MHFVPRLDRRDAIRLQYQDTDTSPRLCLPSGEYCITDMGPRSVRFHSAGVPGFRNGQRLTASIAFPGGTTVAADGAIYRISRDGVVICFDRDLPTDCLSCN